MSEARARIGFGAAVAFAAAAVLAIVAVQWWQGRPEHGPEKPEKSAPEQVVKTAPTAPTMRGECTFQVGDQLAFDVTERRRWRIDLGCDAAGPLPVNLAGVPLKSRVEGEASLRWRVDMRAVSIVEGGTPFVATVSRPTVATARGPQPMGPPRMTVPFLVRVGKRCDVESMARPATLDNRSARAQQSLLQRLSYRLPKSGQRRYTEAERDPIGVHRWDYTVLPGEVARLRRVPTSTIEQYMFDSREGSQEVQSSGRSVVVPGDRGWFASLSVDLQRRFVDGSPYAWTHDNLQARPTAPVEIAGDYHDTINGWIWGDLLAMRAAVLEDDPAGGMTGLGGMPLSTLRRMLHELLSDAALDATAGIDLARDWARANADAVRDLVESLRENGDGDQTAPLMLLALRLTNNDAMQRVLNGLVIDPSQPVQARAGAMLAMACSRLLENEAIDEWRKMAVSAASSTSVPGKMARAATAAMGHAAWLQRPIKPSLSQRIADILRDLLASATHEEAMVTAMTGIGNAGDDTLAELLVGRHRTGDPQVRSALARATARMHPQSAAAVLEDWAATEPDDGVKMALAEAAATQVAHHRGDPEALRSIAGPPITLLGAALEKGAVWASGALKERLAAEEVAKSPNPSIVGEIRAVLARYAPEAK